MRALLRALIVSLVAVVPACMGSPGDQAAADLAHARAQFSRPAAYRFTWQEGCLCPSDVTRAIRIDVAGDAITTAVYADDQKPVAEPVRGNLKTVPGVFDLIQAAIDADAVRVTVDYDPAIHYPTSVFIDYKANIADEELALHLTDFSAP